MNWTRRAAGTGTGRLLRTNRLYVKVPRVPQVQFSDQLMAGNPTLIEPENRPTDGQKTDLMMVGKPSPNQTTINNLTESQTKGVSGEPPAPYGRYQNIFLSQTEYDELQAEYPRQAGTVHRGNEPLPCCQREKLPELCRRPADMGGERQTESPEKRAYQTTHARRARVYEERNQRCFGEYDDCHPRAGGLHRRGRLLYCGKCLNASRKKPILRRSRPLSLAVTASRQSATAREPPARNGRPPRSGAGTLTPWKNLKRRALPTPPCGLDFLRTTTAGTRRPGLPAVCEHWEDMRADNIGCLFWGGVGTGKSYLAGCIANALMEKEIPVHMTNFALILTTCRQL